jgi:RNA polymerase sigma-70 factor (ECF subfamily)
VVDAFLAAARGGDLAGLVAVLDPDVVLRADHGEGQPLQVVRGAERVAAQAASFRGPVDSVEAVLVNGEPGILARVGGRPVSVLAFTVRSGRIAAISIVADPVRLASLGV